MKSLKRSWVRNVAGVLGVSLAVACASRLPAPLARPSETFALRAHQFENLGNGLTVLWIEDDRLPYVSLQMMIKAGSAQDPLGREGLANLTADMLTKGTVKRAGPKLSADLEQVGSDVQVEVTPDYTVVATSALTTSRDEILDTFREILLTPSFPATELERHRRNQLAALTRLPDDADAFAQHIFPQFLYGAGHAYGHAAEGNAKSLAAIKRPDLTAFYARHFVPANGVLAVVGQFDEAWRSDVRKAFGAWQGTAPQEQPPGDFPAWKGVESLLIDKPDLNQAQVIIGTKGVARDVPEYLEVRAGLKILGEGFGSRLFEEIRVRRGLTYGIGPIFDPRERPGPLGIFTFTRVDKVPELVTETLNVYRALIAGGVTDAEVARIKAQMRAQFVHMFETSESLARQLLLLNRYHINEDYLADHMRKLDAVSTAGVNAAIKRHFNPDDLRILIYAPKAAAEPTLKALGPVEVKSYRLF